MATNFKVFFYALPSKKEYQVNADQIIINYGNLMWMHWLFLLYLTNMANMIEFYFYIRSKDVNIPFKKKKGLTLDVNIPYKKKRINLNLLQVYE